MTPEQAREIDRQEFEAESKAIRQRAYALVGRKTPIVITPEPKQAKQQKPIKRAPSRPKHKLYSYAGLTMTLRDWSAHLGIPYDTLVYRNWKGWPVHRLFAQQKLNGRCRRGVVSNFAPSEGTGAGSTAQETPEITFPEKANS